MRSTSGFKATINVASQCVFVKVKRLGVERNICVLNFIAIYHLVAFVASSSVEMSRVFTIRLTEILEFSIIYEDVRP